MAEIGALTTNAGELVGVLGNATQTGLDLLAALVGVLAVPVLKDVFDLR